MEKNIGMEILKELREIKEELKTISANTGMIEDFDFDVEDIEKEIAIEKGNAFEEFVRDRFEKKYFDVVRWNTDICRKRDEYIESDSDPDMVIRYKYKGKNEQFAVECKYRKNTNKGKITWSKYPQMNRYRKYQEENGYPVFVVIGLGGEPESPEKMFCIPLDEIKYPGLYPKEFESFEINPSENFFWKDNVLS
nr:hypothetical protein [uncultured Methanolobus sp.]